MLFSEETDYLLSLIRTDLMNLTEQVTDWQNESINQTEYDSMVADTLRPKLIVIEKLIPKLEYTASNDRVVFTLMHSIDKLGAAMTYRLSPSQIQHAIDTKYQHLDQ